MSERFVRAQPSPMPPRLARAVLVGAFVVAIGMSVPMALLTHGLAATHLGGLTGNHAAMGLGGRAMLAGLPGLVTAGAVWALWPDVNSARRRTAMRRAKRTILGAGWRALIRRVRGLTPDDAALLARRRADRHSDAPPRAPLSASRDLPPVSPVAPPPRRAGRHSAFSQRIDPAVADGSREPALPGSAPGPAMAPPTHAAADVPFAPQGPDAAAAAPMADLPLIAEADLATLVVRFEQGLARRTAVANAATAQRTFDARSDLDPHDPSVRAALRALRPLAIVPSLAPATARGADANDEPANGVDEDVALALSSALATLRTLTERGRR